MNCKRKGGGYRVQKASTTTLGINAWRNPGYKRDAIKGV